MKKQRLTNMFLSFLAAALFVLQAGTASASAMPAYTLLDPLTQQLTKPTIVALDGQGRIYVAETSNNLVRVYTQGGSLVHTISGLAKPISLAIDAGGRIYIGNRDRGNVEIYDASFQYLRSLGQGNNEFAQPNDIDIAPSGLIYVVDKDSSAISIYNPDGTFNASLGQSGNGNGQFHHPVSLAIDTTAGELVVVDLQQRKDMVTQTMIDGARIQFLQMNGAFKRGYAKFGYDRDKGQLVMPVHAVVDSQSRIYISESRMQKVMVYQNNGAFLGMLDSTESPLRTPLGLAMGKTNKLYVASLLAEQVEIYGIDSYIGMTAAPASLSFQELQFEASGAMKNIVVTNTGNSGFTWTANSAAPWITLPAVSGVVPAAGTAPVNVGVNIDGLEPGQYRGSVTISADTLIAETITVSLTVLPNAILSVSPASLSFASTVGATPAGQILAVENAGGSTLKWNANVNQGWLTVGATSGTAPSALKVYVDITALPAGTYNGTVTVTKQGDFPSMKIIPVSLVLTEPTEPPVEPPPVVNPGGQNAGKKWTVSQVLPGIALNGIWGSSGENLMVVGAGGSILRYDGAAWSEMASPVASALYGIWGSSEANVYAVGENGAILHFNGSDWSPLPVVVQETLRDTWGSSEANVYAVSRNGSVVESFADVTATGVILRGIWGSSESDIFAVGENGTILHYDGSAWTSMDSDTTQWLSGVWGSSESDVFAVGENGAVVHYDGTTWSSMESGTNAPLQAVFGTSGSDVFAVGAGGLILYYNGSGWYSVTTAATEGLNDVWVSANSEVFAVGENGTVVYGKAKFPWMHFIRTVIVVNAAVQNEKRKAEEEENPAGGR